MKVALELHPQNIVFNSADVHKLIELTGATNVGVELDASHLFWQRMDPEWANEWPKDSAWDFVALGKGHDVADGSKGSGSPPTCSRQRMPR